MAQGRDLQAALSAALRAGCPVAPGGDGAGNPRADESAPGNQSLGVSIARVAQVAPAGEQQGDDAADAGERAAIMAEADGPALLPEAKHRAIVAGLLRAARARPPG